jgi:soluble lytic murein transglycosylase-like protein
MAGYVCYGLAFFPFLASAEALFAAEEERVLGSLRDEQVKESTGQRNDADALKRLYGGSSGAGRALANLALGAFYAKDAPAVARQHLALARGGLARRPEFLTALSYYEALSLAGVGDFVASSALLKHELASGRPGEGWMRAIYSVLLVNLVRLGEDTAFLSYYDDFARKFPAARRYQKFAVRFAKALDSPPHREEFANVLESLSYGYPYTAESRWAFRRLLSLHCDDDLKSRKFPVSRDLLVSLGRNGALDEGIPDLIGVLLQGTLNDGRRGTRKLDPVELIESLNRARRGDQALEMALSQLDQARLWKDERLEQRLLAVLVRIYFNQQDYLSANRILSILRKKFPALIENQKIRELMAENYSRLGSHRLAAVEYSSLAGRHPGDAAYPWMQFWSFYRGGLFDDARKVASGRNFLGGFDRENGNDTQYWLARMLERSDPSAAKSRFEELAERAGDSFYGIMAALRLRQKIEPEKMPDVPEDSSIANQRANSRVNHAALGFDDSQPLDELKLAGIFLEARMIEAARLQMAGISWSDQDAEESMVLGQFAFMVDNFRAGLNVAGRMGGEKIPKIKSLSFLTKDRASRPVWKMLYPLAYAPLVDIFGRQTGIDKFFILSIMRTESHYNPDAQSPVGAQGLMQIMPATAVRIARLLGDSAFSINRLREPKVSIAYGSYYLWKLLRYYQGNYALAAAAYNAGPAAVNVWVDACRGCDVDEFVESIPYRETRRYVKTVIRNLITYRSVYGGPAFSAADLSMPSQLAEGEFLF